MEKVYVRGVASPRIEAMTAKEQTRHASLALTAKLPNTNSRLRP